MDTVSEYALKADSGIKKNPLPHQGLEPASVLRLAFQSDVLPTEPSSPLSNTVREPALTCKTLREFTSMPGENYRRRLSLCCCVYVTFFQH